MTKTARFYAIFGGVITLLVVLMALVASAASLRSSQDLRQQAAIKDGPVHVTITAPLELQPQVLATIELSIDTHQTNIDALQLEGVWLGAELASVKFIPAAESDDFRAQIINVTPSDVRLIFTTLDPALPFQTQGQKILGTLEIVPAQVGEVNLVWNNLNSKATAFRQASDVLKALSNTRMPVVNERTLTAPTPMPVSSQQICERTGGTWRQFTNSCTDSCGAVNRKELVCAEVATFGCDCGNNGCWDGVSCIGNPNQVVSKTNTNANSKATPDPYTCVPRPSCVDAASPCEIAEPAAGWCSARTTPAQPATTTTTNPNGVPSATADPDFNNDGKVNMPDLTLFMTALEAKDLRADLDQNGEVNIQDYSLFMKTLSEAQS